MVTQTNTHSIFTNVPLNDLTDFISAAIRKELTAMLPPQKATAEPELLTRLQTAERLKISLPTLHLWTKTGTLQGYRIQGRVLYKSNEVESSLQAMQTIKNR